MKHQALGIVLTWVLCSMADAHDFWIEPSSFQSEVGSAVQVDLKVGENFEGEPVARNPERFEKFFVLGPLKEQPVVGRDGSPSSFLRTEATGLYVVGYRSRRSFIEIEAGKFEAYLREEGLASIIQRRKELGQSNAPGREAYSRCAKSLIQCGAGNQDGFDRKLGFPLDIIPLANPFALRAGGEASFRILFQDKPLTGILVTAMNRGEPQKSISAVSDSQGQVRLKLSKPGTWLVKTVHMIRAPKEVDADWESFWGSLTFEIAD